ncbi:MAG: YitT family protein [Anaerococcus sp.]|nr:YitT family protein [Anaerococcus sp.]
MDELQRYLMMSFAAILMAFGTHFFKYPNSFVIGGVEGMSIIASTFVPFTRAEITLFINVVLLIIGYFALGKHFALRTGYVAILNSLTALGLDYIAPLTGPLTNNNLLELIFTLLISAFGSAILFNLAASSGGTDIIAMIIKKYSSLEVGKALLCVDSIFTIASIWIFDIEIGLLSILGLLLKGIFVDVIIQSLNTDKLFIIITTKPDEVGAFIRDDLNRSATVMNGVGLYKGIHRFVFLLVLSPKEAPLFKRYIKGVDPSAFITIINTSKIIGKGFYLTSDKD